MDYITDYFGLDRDLIEIVSFPSFLSQFPQYHTIYHGTSYADANVEWMIDPNHWTHIGKDFGPGTYFTCEFEQALIWGDVSERSKHFMPKRREKEPFVGKVIKGSVGISAEGLDSEQKVLVFSEPSKSWARFILGCRWNRGIHLESMSGISAVCGPMADGDVGEISLDLKELYPDCVGLKPADYPEALIDSFLELIKQTDKFHKDTLGDQICFTSIEANSLYQFRYL